MRLRIDERKRFHSIRLRGERQYRLGSFRITMSDGTLEAAAMLFVVEDMQGQIFPMSIIRELVLEPEEGS